MERFVLSAPQSTRPLSPEGEEALVGKAQEGDADAFDSLVRAHYERIYATAFHLLGNHEDAEDLAQECFVKAYRSLGWYRGPGAFFAWLRTILVHLARDRFRRESRRPRRSSLDRLGGSDDLPAGPNEPAAELGAREFQRLLAEGLERLPDHLRIALVLRTLDGLEYDEIARATSVAPATVRMQVMKARRALERFLAPYLEGPPRRGGTR